MLPAPRSIVERSDAMNPMALRRRMSRFTRTTEKFVDTAPTDGSSSDCIFSAPMLVRPTRPVSRPPPRIGTDRP